MVFENKSKFLFGGKDIVFTFVSVHNMLRERTVKI